MAGWRDRGKASIKNEGDNALHAILTAETATYYDSPQITHPSQSHVTTSNFIFLLALHMNLQVSF